MSNLQSQFDTGILIRRSLFFLILIILALGNLFTLFRGLNSPEAMDQAQIAREIARGNGFSTKFIRPAAHEQVKTHQQRQSIPFKGFKDTYHSPLNPLLNAAVLKLIGGDNADQWKMTSDELIFPLDRVIATVSTLCFLMAIGVSYLLISRIFDAKIAGVTAILMLFCQTFWDYALSGLPQMLMLLLFSCAIYFVYRAVEDASEGRMPFTSAIIAGVFFSLLAMTHFLTIWIALGYIIFAAIAFRPRGVVGVSVLLLLIIPSVFVMLRNSGITGTPFGTAFFNLYNGIGGGIEEFVMRNQTQPDLLNRGIITTILRSFLIQTVDIIPFLGGIIIAPLFFISLLHPFKRASIANFRWAILLIFVVSAFGLAIFGVSTDELDPNQTHLLFAPIMTGYGLAFISILWSRVPIVISVPMIQNVHHILIVIICALPLVITLPKKVFVGFATKQEGGVPQWPPYYAPALNRGLNKWQDEEHVSFSDQPWAVAWYADRMSIWLPPSKEDFIALETQAADLDTPISGILISPSSYGDGTIAEVVAKYGDFAPLVLDGTVLRATYPPGLSIFAADQNLQQISRRYPQRASLLGFDMAFYSDRVLRITDDKEED